jgi:O-antigen/teichoic acid export membrane protein
LATAGPTREEVEPATGDPVAGESPRGRIYLVYVGLMAAGASLGLIRGLIYAKVLEPQEFGYYGLVVIVLQFGLFVASWGILSALNNHLPIALGKGHNDPELLDRSMGALVITSCITVGVYLLIVSLVNFSDPEVQIALALASGAVIASTLTEFHILVMRVHQGLIKMAMTYVLRASLTIGAGVAAGILFGYRGVVLAELGALVVTLYVARHLWLDPIGIKRPSWPATRRLIRAGLPLTVANLIVVLSFVADRLFVAAALPDQFGQYAFAALVVVAWIAIVAMLEQAVAPRLLREYGSGMSLREVRRQAVRVALSLAAAGAAGLALLIALIGPLEDGFLSSYADGLRVAPILYVGGLLLVMSFPGFVLHAIRPSFSALASALAASVSVGGAALLVLLADPSLNEFAWVFVAGQAAALSALMIGLQIEVAHDTQAPHVLSETESPLPG